MQEDYQPARTGQQIEWICDVCKSPIDDALGGVWITYHHIRKASTPSPQAGVMTVSEIMALLEDGPTWRITHDRCAPRDTLDDSYWLPVESLRTPATLLNWTAHLLGKTWLPNTDWDDVIRRALEGRVG